MFPYYASDDLVAKWRADFIRRFPVKPPEYDDDAQRRLDDADVYGPGDGQLCMNAARDSRERERAMFKDLWNHMEEEAFMLHGRRGKAVVRAYRRLLRLDRLFYRDLCTGLRAVHSYREMEEEGRAEWRRRLDAWLDARLQRDEWLLAEGRHSPATVARVQLLRATDNAWRMDARLQKVYRSKLLSTYHVSPYDQWPVEDRGNALWKEVQRAQACLDSP